MAQQTPQPQTVTIPKSSDLERTTDKTDLSPKDSDNDGNHGVTIRRR